MACARRRPGSSPRRRDPFWNAAVEPWQRRPSRVGSPPSLPRPRLGRARSTDLSRKSPSLRRPRAHSWLACATARSAHDARPRCFRISSDLRLRSDRDTPLPTHQHSHRSQHTPAPFAHLDLVMFGPGSSTLNLARQPCTQAPPKAGLGYSTVFAKRAGSHISSASSEASGRVRLLRSLTHPEARRRNVQGRPPPQGLYCAGMNVGSCVMASMTEA